MKFHETIEGERIGELAHRAHAIAAFVAGCASLLMFGFSVSGLLWHYQGSLQHRDARLELEREERKKQIK